MDELPPNGDELLQKADELPRKVSEFPSNGDELLPKVNELPPTVSEPSFLEST